jgi:hypothetical protein
VFQYLVVVSSVKRSWTRSWTKCTLMFVRAAGQGLPRIGRKVQAGLLRPGGDLDC